MPTKKGKHIDLWILKNIFNVLSTSLKRARFRMLFTLLLKPCLAFTFSANNLTTAGFTIEKSLKSILISNNTMLCRNYMSKGTASHT